jgi:hypothetical protein
MTRLTKVLMMGVVVAGMPLLSCGGCVMAQQGDIASTGFEWVLVGTNERGCEMFTKQSTSPNVVVDSAIWYLDANGNYTPDANACVPSSPKGVEK